MKQTSPKLASSELLLSADRFDVHRRRFHLGTGPAVTRDIVVHPGAVVVLPLLDPDRVLMIHNYRYSIEQELLELPAGTLEPDETPTDCALRELAEETGYRAGTIRPLGMLYPSPGILTERIHVLLAADLEKTRPQLADGELIRTEIIPLTRLTDDIAENRIHDAKTIASIFMYMLTKERAS